MLIGQRLRDIREMRNLRQDDIEKATGLSGLTFLRRASLLKSPGQLLQRFDGRHSMPIFNAGDIASKQASPFFYVALGEILLFPNNT